MPEFEQCCCGTMDAGQTLFEFNADGWRLIAVLPGQWASGAERSNTGLTMFFERPRQTPEAS